MGEGVLEHLVLLQVARREVLRGPEIRRDEAGIGRDRLLTRLEDIEPALPVGLHVGQRDVGQGALGVGRQGTAGIVGRLGERLIPRLGVSGGLFCLHKEFSP